MEEDTLEAEQDDQPWLMPREYEIGGVRWFNQTVQELQRALHPLLAQIPRAELADGPPRIEEGEPPPPEASRLYRPMKTSHVWTVSVEDVVEFKLDQFLADTYAVAEGTGAQMVKGFFELISQVSEDHGNVIQATDRDFFDVYADAMEKIELEFDAEGNPTTTIFMHPDLLEKLKDKKPTPEQEARLNAILERRREEWRAARRRRDLS
ncbi:hypothetical protein GCM10009721_39160 [Terrabacter tumescens]|uniref:Tail assembly chaperone n=1 Tax=Terrabacter tumescens TaxID=60443 RepID=A0ABQ2IFX0_9MICO|nr:hypothetical protein [Terrabacter tumescens]GGN07647.1 hypothetical protein GCM10009721_39160 [Terrabacter tumescens]